MSLVNAWDGCLEQAESGYNLLLTLNPRDAEARAGLIDILTWQGRWDEVLANLEAGVRLNPRNPTLLMRQAKLLYWSGDVTAATDILRQARQQGARGEEVENLRRRLYSDQLRTMMRIDKFPAGYPQVYSWGMQELHRMHRWELSLGTTLFRHSGGGVDSMVDGRHVAGVAYYPGIASSVGLNLGFGSPARYVPTFETKAWALFPLGHLFSGYFAYALWQYGTHKSVHMFAPAVGYTVIDGINIELRWWTSYVVLHAPALAVNSVRTGLVHSVGLFGRVQMVPELAVGASYTYGTQLDENPIIARLFPLRSHVVTLFSDWALDPRMGLQPIVGVERRQSETTAVFIFSGELGVYWRW